jgi:multidrug resistance efflux pump
MLRARSSAVLLAAAPLLAACAGAPGAAGVAGAAEQAGPGGPAAHAGAAPPLAALSGEFRGRLLLTGELQAAEARVLAVPRAPSWQLQVRWLADDGARVRAGEPVVEFDNSQFAGDLGEKRAAAAEQAAHLERDRAAAARREAEKRFAVDQRRAAVDKARLRAGVPEALVAQRELADRRLELRRAELELEKALTDVEAERRASRADLELVEIDLARARREIVAAEEAIRALRLTAPADGILLVAEHPWEGRKLQAGDNVWVGLPVARMPDLATLMVEAVLFDVDDGRVAPGMEAVATLDAYPELRLPGRVAEVSPVAREVERSTLRRYFRVAIALQRVDPERMRPGMSVKVEVETAARDDVLVAPRVALDLDADPPRAALAGGGWAAVALGPCDAGRCVVERGLDPGARLRPAAPAAAGGSG